MNLILMAWRESLIKECLIGILFMELARQNLYPNTLMVVII